MNRQVIPSMILSVLIVCFFSIVLYEREKPGAIVRPGANPEPATTSASATQNADKPPAPTAAAAKGPDATKVVDEGPQREIKGPAKTETPPASTADQHAQGMPAEEHEKGKPVPVAEAPAVAAVKSTKGPGTAPFQVVTRSADPVSIPKEKPVRLAAGSSPARPAHRSPFTTVRDGETLEDVAIRIYGSSDQLDLLWRANRDILPRKNSPLSAEAVLRTPEE
jgi:hypothetical protein